ncbi:MAG: imidazolonepropionase [Actinobacteria bacterium]|uniref:imidazolonepropionase n=1 Tax=freshwater metagenome TaxID=449393 RepID=A0A6J5YYC1_9ZZZZ|nr:imidazolonepropionase [Actinomycetota bacterium]
MAAPSISINSAAQVLRPPQDGLPYMRANRAAELRTDAGALSLTGGLIDGFEAAAGAQLQIDAEGCAVIPGFVDCHTHLPFAGWRADEYNLKVTGASYEQIAQAGGGIKSSAIALDQASDDEVIEQAQGLADEMLRHGTTTFETKSGYGMSVEGEMRALALAARLDQSVAQQTASTALLAHALPADYDVDGWMAEVALMAAQVAHERSASALDIYVESVAFDNEQLRKMGELAKQHGFDLRAHVEQFNTNRSVPVALEMGARSVDHLACLDPDDLPALAESECAAVLLPGAEFLGKEEVAPGRELADAGAITVIATDANPGTSPIVSMPLIIGLAVRRYGWTALEALLSATLNPAWLLRCSDVTGSLETGKRADVVILDGPIENIAYRFGHNPVAAVICGGELVHVREDWKEHVSGEL